MTPQRGRKQSRNDRDGRKSTTHQHPSYGNDTPTSTRTRLVRKWRRRQEGTGQRQQNSKSCPFTLTPSLPARSSAFTPTRSPVSMSAHPHTISARTPTHPPASTTTSAPAPAPASTVATTSIDGHDSHLTTSTDDRGSHPQPQRGRLLLLPPAPAFTAAVATLSQCRDCPLSTSQFQHTDANSFSEFFFPVFFLFFAPPAPVSR